MGRQQSNSVAQQGGEKHEWCIVATLYERIFLCEVLEVERNSSSFHCCCKIFRPESVEWQLPQEVYYSMSTDTLLSKDSTIRKSATLSNVPQTLEMDRIIKFCNSCFIWIVLLLGNKGRKNPTFSKIGLALRGQDQGQPNITWHETIWWAVIVRPVDLCRHSQTFKVDKVCTTCLPVPKWPWPFWQNSAEDDLLHPGRPKRASAHLLGVFLKLHAHKTVPVLVCLNSHHSLPGRAECLLLCFLHVCCLYVYLYLYQYL